VAICLENLSRRGRARCRLLYLLDRNATGPSVGWPIRRTILLAVQNQDRVGCVDGDPTGESWSVLELKSRMCGRGSLFQLTRVD
jgi:hypothetical protein